MKTKRMPAALLVVVCDHNSHLSSSTSPLKKADPVRLRPDASSWLR